MTLRKIMLATVVSVLVAGCGGATTGEGGGNTVTTPETQSKKDGFAYLNELRRGAGIKEFKYIGTIEKAAQAHANYLNDVYARYGVNDVHGEPHESQYRTGDTPHERKLNAGWKWNHGESYTIGGDEVISYNIGGDDTIPYIKYLLTAIYHRFGILNPQMADVGIGLKNNDLPCCVIDFGREMDVSKDSTNIIVYPYNGEKDVQLYFSGGETPNPLTGTGLTTTGNPISVEFNTAKISNVTLKSFSLKDGSGAEVDIAFTLKKSNDQAGLITDHQFAFFPRESLAYDENYTAKITYVADGVAGSKEWSFKTIAQPKEDGGDDSPQNQDINVTDTNQTVLVKAEQYYNLHILPGNDSIANGNTLGNLNYIDGKTANNKDNSVASYDKDNIIQVYVYGNSGDWAILEITNLQNSNTGEKFKVRLQVE